MIIMEGEVIDTTIKKLLEVFQECTRRGEQAKLILETRNGMTFTNFSVKIPVSRPGMTSTLSKKKTPSTLRRDQERMAKFLQKKTSQGSFSTSTPLPKTFNPTMPTSSSQALETTSEADSGSCETAGLDTRATEQNGDDTETTKEKKGWTEEDFAQFSKLLKESSRGTLKKSDILDLDLNLENQKKDDNDIIDENSDYLEAAKKWTVQQKLSLTKKK